jgi:hypothetical protein
MSTPEIALHGSPAYLREARKAKWLSWASLIYMAMEGIVAVVAGIVAGSIALIGFGLDSAIEGFASVIIVWRFTGWRTLSHEAERRPRSWSRSSSSSSRRTSPSSPPALFSRGITPRRASSASPWPQAASF